MSLSLTVKVLGSDSGFIYTFGESSIARERTLMSEESSPVLPPEEESIEAETDIPLETELELGEPAPHASSEPGFVCDCEEFMRSACNGLPFYKEHESQRYCVLHYPGKEKRADFKAALDIKLTNMDFDFRGVWFPDEVDFSRIEFGADAYFTFAIFSNTANFRLVRFIGSSDFRSATFRETAYYTSGTFGATAIFRSATFKKAADFGSAKFAANADFSSVTFGADAFLVSATFNGNADFSSALFDSDA